MANQSFELFLSWRTPLLEKDKLIGCAITSGAPDPNYYSCKECSTLENSWESAYESLGTIPWMGNTLAIFTYLPMAHTTSKKRKLEDVPRRTSRPSKKFRKQTNYDSSSTSPSADEFHINDLATTDSDHSLNLLKSVKASHSQTIPTVSTDAVSSSSTSDADSDSTSSTPSGASKSRGSIRKVPKRKDPLAFSTSMATILGTKLPTSVRQDPVLSRSKTAKEAAHSIVDAKLETKARRALRDERKKASEKGRVRDVLLGDRPTSSALGSRAGADGNGDTLADIGGQDGAETAAQILEQERRLRKTAQRGVVKLFNAVRAAQVKGEEAAREAKKSGVVGVKRREERVREMGKQAFLEMVAGGGK